ncbi:MAG: ATP-binding cassette domain-containing protein [Candidatus Dadabacteria bacterium]|nr:ATP-binding cassette domain-containing protein [Candidatus Dadabacteria bacterium]MYC40164.1 ATP-binding cassette domain-containing protein [Candidatus Dadabacteria bacterium]
MEENKAIVSIKGLKKYFPIRGGVFSRVSDYVRAVDDVELEIKRGSTVGLVGESGSGKTTLGKTVLRLLVPTAGKIFFEGEDITALDSAQIRPLRREMQMIFQNPYGSLNPRMNVGSLVSEGISIHNTVKKEERHEFVARLLGEVGLGADVMGRYPHEFSGGQRQRIAIARAISLHPKFVVCDEPVSALDVSVQAQIINLLNDLQKKHGLSYLFISHDLRVVKHISDLVAVMYLGKIVEIAPSDEIYSNPVHPYTKMLISAIPEIKRTRSKNGKEASISGEIRSLADIPSGCSFHPRCPLATEICSRETPRLEKKGTDGRSVACHNV